MYAANNQLCQFVLGYRAVHRFRRACRRSRSQRRMGMENSVCDPVGLAFADHSGLCAMSGIAHLA